VVTSMEETRGSWLIGIPHVPRGFVFGVIIPLNLVEPSSLVACDSVLLVLHLDGICSICQIRFQCDGVFDNNISQRLRTPFELGDMKHIMHSR
jgi:hypothetical protein